MTRVTALILVLSIAPAFEGAEPAAYKSARKKLDIIESNRAPANTVYSFSKAEIEAWAAVEIPQIVPEGFRDARVELGTDVATGRAYIDFMKLRHAKGGSNNWFLDKLLQGERPVAVTVQVQSAKGKCTVYLKKLEISGVSATGTVLDLLIKTFFMPLFPDAKIGQPFELDHRIERIALRPVAAYAKIKSTPPAPASSKK